MVCAYMPDGCVWNGIKNVLPDSYIETISVGDVLDDDTINPCAASDSARDVAIYRHAF